MSQEDPNTGGLLSKVVKFVKNPTVSWADLDRADEDKEATYSKAVLKEMIERKRRNDFVRKREFDMLRKIRRQGVLAGDDPAGRPSFFHSSLPSRPDDRAQTLRKIDEIEAQMSQQWWKTKHTAGPGAAGAQAGAGGPVSQPLMGQDSDLPPSPSPITIDPALADHHREQASFQPTDAEAVRPSRASELSYVRTRPTPIEESPAAAAKPEPPSEMLAEPPVPMLPDSFTPTEVSPLAGDDFVHDPELEEAAIRFANGDNAGAEAGLLEAIGVGGSRRGHEETWMTLFDLYRATGQQERFESLAIDYAGRFGRTGPLWFSLPELVQRMGAGDGAEAPRFGADWKAPADMGLQTVAVLSLHLDKAAPPWRLDWSRLKTLDDDALEPLSRLLNAWCAREVSLAFIASEQLDAVLRKGAPSADKSVDPARWHVRLAALRVMNRPDEFELAALDYCVTYEVSPPSWETPRCRYQALDSEGNFLSAHTIVGDHVRDTSRAGLDGYDPSHADTELHPMGQRLPHAQDVSALAVDLAGEVLGDAAAALAVLDARLQQEGVTRVSCAHLIRVDFAAAGTLLNWVTARQAEGRLVHFVDLNRLIATFFNVIGINDHARIAARRH